MKKQTPPALQQCPDKVIRKPHHHNPFGLTRREFEILRLMADGPNNRDIARELTIRERTVANHVSNILFKIDAKNRTEAACIARKEGLIHYPALAFL